MTAVTLASALVGRPVVTLDAAEEIAEIRGVLLAAGGIHVVGFSLGKRGRLAGGLKEVLPWARISALGPDAVMVANGAVLVAPTSEMRDTATSDRVLLGSRVLTDKGRELGKITDLALVLGSRPVLAGLLLRGARGDSALLPVPPTLKMSKGTVLVADDIETLPGIDLNALITPADEPETH